LERVSRFDGARQPTAVHERVREVALACPHLLAISDDRRSLTYGELDAAADALAHHLRALGVRRGARVGLCRDRSATSVVGALAAWRAGGAYVALDPAYPPARLASMLDDASVPVVLTQTSACDRLASVDACIVDLDTWCAPQPPAPHTCVDGATDDDVAYVVYTSGSTGRPKGVEVSHRNLAHLVDWHCDAFSIGRCDRASVLASPAFDASVWEVWPYLTAGASVHVVDASIVTAPSALRDWLLATGVTVSFVPTPLAELLLDVDWPDDVALRVLLTGGDRLRRRPRAGLPFTVVNNYGVAEATVVSTSGVVDPAAAANRAPTIGRAIARTPLYVLDADGRRVPDGTAGELHIGGAGVAIGYLDRPELTAARFLPDRFASTPGARMYRTGDRVRVAPNGELEFLGRLDDQVQVRGHRVELGEVQAALETHARVACSAVVATAHGGGETHLVACVVMRDDEGLDRAELRAHLAQRLPDAMVPHVFVELDALPITTNGKVDRDALVALVPAAPVRDPAATATSETAASVIVRSILEELLELPDLGPDDNFFELGGHSLLGAQLIARLEDVFHVEVSHLDLFDHPTAAGLVAVIEREQVAP
jgi:amino acid adenylation domain-containing protein